MTIKCMYYGKHFEKKPQGYEAGQAQKNLAQSEITIEKLADELSHGASFKPALLNGTKSTDWISQQLFALDFDHDTTIQEQLAKCKELNILPCFGYTSFSHSEQEHHFRLVFCSEVLITDTETRNKLQKTLIATFDKSDKVTFDATRMFFGGNSGSLICSDFDNRINAQWILDTYYKDDPVQKSSQGKSKKEHSPKKEKSDNIGFKDDNMTLKVEAIKKRNVEVMQSLLNTSSNNPLIFTSQNDLYTHIKSLDLSEYLGVYGLVNCILPDHEDSTPSAHIYNTDDGTPVYKCFGCNKVRTLIGITEELAGCKRSEAIEFIKAVYNLRLEQSDWAKQQQQIMIDSANYLDTEEFKQEFPVLSSLVRTRKAHIQLMLMHFTQYVSDDLRVDGKPVFFASYDTLMKVCKIKDRTRMSQSLSMFALLNMIEKLPAEKIPEKELIKAKSIAAKYGHKKITNFYSFEEYGVNSLSESEERAKILKSNNMTLKGLGQEYVLRTFGTDVADKVYPQHKFENQRGTSKASNARTLDISECLLYLVDKHGYTTEKDIVYLLGKKYRYETTEIQIKKSLQEILLSYGLKRIRANKDIKEQYNIGGNGYPFIVVRE